MHIGYSRVSQTDPNLQIQITALREAKCERIIKDRASGTKSNRQSLEAVLDHLQKGDVLVVYALDRLGKTTKGVLELIMRLHNSEIHFKCISDNIDTTNDSGKIFLQTIKSLVQTEQNIIAERTSAGVKAAKKYGRTGGRKRKMTDIKMQTAQELFLKQVPPKEIANSLEISVPTLYRWLPAAQR